MPNMDFFTPNPVTSREQLPAMPTMLMKKRFLYRKMFRTVTFQVKLNRFHRKGIRSRMTRLPALGALGRIRVAGTSFKDMPLAARVARPVQARMDRMLAQAISGRKGI